MHITTNITHSLKRRKREKGDCQVEFKFPIIDVIFRTSTLRWIEVPETSNMDAQFLLELVGAEHADVQEKTFF